MRVLLNGKFYTVNKSLPWAEAIVIDGNKIAYVGTNKGAKKYIKKGVEVSDLQNKFATPGLIDGHAHPINIILNDCFLNIDSPNNSEQLLAQIGKYINEHKEISAFLFLSWDISFYGWSEPHFDNLALSKEIIDKLCPDKPVVILLANAHEGWCNSKALELANINKNTQDPDFDRKEFFGRGADGQLTGYFVGRRCISTIISGADYFDNNILLKSAKKFSGTCSSLGITSLIDCGCTYYAWNSIKDKIATFVNSNNSNFRLAACGVISEQGSIGIEGMPYPWAKTEESSSIGPAILEAFEELKLVNNQYNSDKFKCNFLKIADKGHIEKESNIPKVKAATKGDGHPELSVRDLVVCAWRCAKAGIDINIQAFYSEIVTDILKAITKIRERGYNNFRATISIARFVKPCDIELFNKYNVTINPHAEFITKIPIETLNKAKDITNAKPVPLMSLKKTGARISIGSNSQTDIEYLNPLKNMEEVITRQAVDSPNALIVDANEGLTVSDTIEAYTINNAYQMRMEDKIGTLEVGKYADITIFDQNLFDIDLHAIHDVKVIETIMDGITRYKDEH